MKNEPETKILIVIVFIVLIIFTVYISLAQDFKMNKVSSEANITNSPIIDPEAEYYKSLDNGYVPNNEPSVPETENKTQIETENKTQTETYNKVINNVEEIETFYPNMPKKLTSLGFKDISNNDDCRNDDKCYENNEYRIDYGESAWFEVSKKVTDMKNYDVSSDLKFIAGLFNDNQMPKLSSSINNILHSLDDNYRNDSYYSFNINGYGKYMFIRYSRGELEYSVSDGLNLDYYKKGIFAIDNINSIIDSMSENNKKSIKKTMYDTLMETNKNKYKYYDYVNNHLDEGVCAVDIKEKNYSIATSYCHGGTSNTSFRLSHQAYGNSKESIKTTVKTSYFTTSYLNFIKNDLSYFSEKLNVKLELSQENINDLDTAVKGKLENYSIKVSDKVIINLKYKFYNEYADYFYITYEFM